MEIILQKFIAQTGYCSRRKAEELIRGGLVRVNGVVAKVGEYFEEKDLSGKLDVSINGKSLNLPDEKIYIILNKPVGYVCTTQRFKGEKNVFELLKENPSHPPLSKRGGAFLLPSFLKGRAGEGSSLIIAGRLDKDSRGLLLLTNDGELVYQLTHPKFQHEKKYIVEIDTLRQAQGRPETTTQRQLDLNFILDNFKKGIDIGEGDGVVRVKRIRCLDPLAKENLRFEIVLTEGKKRQIRRMFKKIGFKVVDLARVGIGPERSGLELGNLEEGKWRSLTEREIKILKSGK